MQRRLVFIPAFVLTLLVVAFLAMTLSRQRPVFFSSETKGLERFLVDVQRVQRPKTVVDFSTLYGWNGRFEVLDPAFSTREWKLASPVPNCNLDQSSNHGSMNEASPALRCDSIESTSIADRELFKKQNELAAILRGEKAATDSFLLTPPFLDENGRSFAAWLFDKDLAPLNDRFWVAEHLSLFKPSELANVLARIAIHHENFETVARLARTDLRSLIEGVPALITDNELFIRDRSRLGFSLSYSVYDLKAAKSLAGDFDLVNSAVNDLACVESLGNICWTYNSQTTIARLQKYEWYLLSVAVLALAFATFIYARDAIMKATERERLRLSLQVLSHEFRTPVASMILLINGLRDRLPEFSEGDQDALIRMSSEASKLQRIIEMTKSYLQSSEGPHQFKIATISSLNEWVAEFAMEFDSRVRVGPLLDDRSIAADPYWLRFALSNLVQNAFAHGCEPVFIRLSNLDNRISISVEDQGVCEFESLRHMAKPFEKSRKSAGMGLGLSITEAIIRECNGTLRFETAPTSFIISFAASSQ